VFSLLISIDAVVKCATCNMPILEKLRNIFAGSGDGKRKLRHYEFIRRDVDPSEFWDIVGELGDGAFGKVYKVQSPYTTLFSLFVLVAFHNFLFFDFILAKCSIVS